MGHREPNDLFRTYLDSRSCGCGMADMDVFEFAAMSRGNTASSRVTNT